jgi:VanZ family protein
VQGTFFDKTFPFRLTFEIMFIQRTFWAWLWALCILFLCLLPGEEVPDRYLINADKIFHMLSFTLLVFLMIPSFIRQYTFRWLRFHAVKFSFGFSVFFGGAIELLQHVGVSNRNAEWIDWLMDVAGSLLGVAIFYLVYGFGHTKNERYEKYR